MTLTNKFNLPEPFVKALGLDDYERGGADFTTTELIRPVRINALTREHWDEITEDVSERVWAFAGQTKHIVLERIAKTDPDRYLVEERMEIVMPGGAKISGKIDLYDLETKIQYDWKEQSVWKFIMGDLKEWTAQGNINRYLLLQNGFAPEKLINVTWLRDWKKRMARTTKRDDYPQCPIHVCELEAWSIGATQAYILDRIREQEQGRENPPVCTKEERWQRDHVWALHKKNRKSAIRLFDNLDQAEAALKQTQTNALPGQQFYIEERQAEPVRCLDFCQVQQFCDFGREMAKKWRDNNEKETT